MTKKFRGTVCILFLQLCIPAAVSCGPLGAEGATSATVMALNYAETALSRASGGIALAAVETSRMAVNVARAGATAEEDPDGSRAVRTITAYAVGRVANLGQIGELDGEGIVRARLACNAVRTVPAARTAELTAACDMLR